MKELFYHPALEQDPAFATLAKKIRAMPKVELHVHLEGSMESETIYEMAQRNKIVLPAKNLEEWKSYYQFKNFEHFIEIYITAARSLIEPADYVFMLERFCALQAAQNIFY